MPAPTTIPFALHAHLAPRPELRDWLQKQLQRVTIPSRATLQRRLWKEFPGEPLMVPSELYPAFWTWDRESDAREVLLEMYGFENKVGLNERLRQISRALKAFDATPKPTDTPFSLQSAEILLQLDAVRADVNGDQLEVVEQTEPVEPEVSPLVPVPKVKRPPPAKITTRLPTQHTEHHGQPESAASESSLAGTSGFCSGVTKRNTPCKMRCHRTTAFCKQHQDQKDQVRQPEKEEGKEEGKEEK